MRGVVYRVRWYSVQAMQRWCPNCEFFFKDLGMNYCHKANWSLHPLDGGDQAVLGWLDVNQPDDSTRILDNADDCPGFLPYAELAQRYWREHIQ